MIALWAGFKIYIIAAAAAILLGGVLWFAAHERGVGAAKVQAKWDKSVAAQSVAVAKAVAAGHVRTASLQAQYDTLLTTYEETAHARLPAVADSVVDDLAAGHLRLRDNPVCGSYIAAATASARTADAAYTQALADRTANAITAVRASDASDARERELGAKVTALQGVVRADRQKNK